MRDKKELFKEKNIVNLIIASIVALLICFLVFKITTFLGIKFLYFLMVVTLFIVANIRLFLSKETKANIGLMKKIDKVSSISTMILLIVGIVDLFFV